MPLEGRRAFELEFDMGSEPYLLSFDEEKMRGSAGFRDLWSIGFPLDQLSRRRRTAQFGWIKNPSQNDLSPEYLFFVHHGSGYCPCSENEKCACSMVVCICSWDLIGNRFFVGNKPGCLFHC
jgi:hypothetical protein